MPFNIKERISNIPKVFLVGLASIPAAVETVVGVAASAVSIVTADTFKTMNRLSHKGYMFEGVLPNLFMATMKVINPKFEAEITHKGLVTNKLAVPILKFAAKSAKNEDKVHRECVSRVGYLFYTLASIATRIADFVSGIFAGIASLLTAGCFTKVNSFAVCQLSALGVIGDVCYGLRRTVNPHP